MIGLPNLPTGGQIRRCPRCHDPHAEDPEAPPRGGGRLLGGACGGARVGPPRRRLSRTDEATQTTTATHNCVSRHSHESEFDDGRLRSLTFTSSARAKGETHFVFFLPMFIQAVLALTRCGLTQERRTACPP